MPKRHFPPPWYVDDPGVKLGQECFIVRDANGHAPEPNARDVTS